MLNRVAPRRSSTSLRRAAVRGACAVLLTVAPLALVACGDDDDKGASATTAGAATSAFPVTVKHKLGTTTIPKAPERVVALGIADDDIALALGVTPVALGKGFPEGNGLLPWQNSKLAGKKTTVLNLDTSTPFEKIAALRPDLILASGHFTVEKDYPKLSKIAPTIAFKNGSYKDTYQEQTRLVAQALGRSEQAETVLTDLDRKIAEVKSSHPEYDGKTMTLAFMSDANTINVVTAPDDPTIKLLGEIGVGLSKSVSTLPKNGQGGIQGAIGLEQLPRLEADSLVLTYASPALQKQLEANRVFKKLPVVARGDYTAMDLATVTGLRTLSVLSIPYGLDKVVAALDKTTD